MKKKDQGYRQFFRITGIFFAGVILVTQAVSLVKPSRDFSQKENRVLTGRPAFQLSKAASGKFESQYETYRNDQFPLRDFWVTVKASTDRILGKTDENGVYAGKNGYLIEAFSPPTEERLNATLNAMTDFAARHPELKQYALLAPNAVNILKDYLPADAPAADQNPYINRVQDTLSQAGVVFIDVRNSLIRHKDEGIYYHTDHHWTTQGAFFAFMEAAPAMGVDSSAIAYDKLPVSEDFQGTLSAKSGMRGNEKDELCVFLPRTEGVPSSIVNYVDEQKKTGSFYATAQLDGRDKYALFFNGNHPEVKITTPTQENRTLLILKDSYANSLVPFLAPYYRTIIMIDPRYYYGDLEQLIKSEGVQEVLYLYNANTFFADTSLELTLTPQDDSEDSLKDVSADETISS